MQCRLQTLSRERPGGREGEEGSSRPRGFFGLGGTASEAEVTGGAASEEDVTGGTEGSERQKERPETGVHQNRETLWTS